VVGIVALPLALAFAIASGVPPERGLYTAIIAGFLISALGGSRVQIGGPTGAFVVIVYGIVAKYGYEGLVLSTMLAGVILIVMGLARMGALIKFIPYPVITGFTSGIAVIIFSSQVKDFLGLKMGAHERMALVRRTAARAEERRLRIDHHVRPDGFRGSHGRGAGRRRGGVAAVHEADGRGDEHRGRERRAE
jgi:MFS superfamily sulfate permease-like transporter